MARKGHTLEKIIIRLREEEISLKQGATIIPSS